MKPQTKKWNPALLLPVLLACGGALLTGAFAAGADVWNRLTFEFGQTGYIDYFMDFFNSVFLCSELKVYEIHGSIYPPAANLVYFALSKLVDLKANPLALRASMPAMTLFVIYNLVVLTGLAIMVGKLVGGSRRRQLAAGILCLATEPVIYAVERGNIVILAAAFCAAFLLWYRSESRRMREVALVCLALAANLKIYPAALGLLLLMDQTGKAQAGAQGGKFAARLNALIPRWKDALRCAGYAAALFFLPFLFMGGLPGLQAMYDSITSTTELFFQNGLGYKIDFRNTLGMLNAASLDTNSFFVSFAETGGYLIGLAGLLHLPLLQGQWRRVTMLCALIAGIPSFSYQYNLTFLLPAAALFFKEEYARFASAATQAQTKTGRYANGMTIVYAVLFAGLLLPLPFAMNAQTWPKELRSVSLCVLVSGASLLLLTLVLMLEAAVRVLCKRARPLGLDKRVADRQ